MNLDTFGEYVHRRLDSWGREFALGRDCEYLGYHSKNMLQVLIEHKGEIPQRGGGHKPQECDVLALEVELIAAETPLPTWRSLPKPKRSPEELRERMEANPDVKAIRDTLGIRS